MVSSIDQMSELVDTIRSGKAPSKSVQAYAFVVYVSGRWHPGTFEGTPSACNEHIERKLKVDLTDPKVKWARGHITEAGEFIIHPANDATAVHTLSKLLASKRRR